jgi:hypothetical protein
MLHRNLRRDPMLKEKPRRQTPHREDHHHAGPIAPKLLQQCQPPERSENIEFEPQHNTWGPRQIRRWTPPFTCAHGPRHTLHRTPRSEFISKVAVRLVGKEALLQETLSSSQSQHRRPTTPRCFILTQSLTKQLQTDQEQTSNTTAQRHISPVVHPRQIPQVIRTGQTGVTWAARDEQHPWDNSPKS